MTTETRCVPLADVLSVTTKHILSRRRMQGVCDLVDWMTFSAPTPDEIDLKVWSGFRMRAQIARRSLLRQFPYLEGVCPQEGLDAADLIAWLLEQECLYGEHVTVERAEVEMRDVFEAMARTLEPLGKWMRETWERLNHSLGPMAKAFAEIGAKIAEAQKDLQIAERTLPEHPDIAELDVQLDGFYGDEGPVQS